MPVFISYSHQDKDFAENLAKQLVVQNVHVWIDRWELSVGDSIVQRIQDAVEGASALLVVLSEASVNSEWCQQELSAGILRELEEQRVIVLPVLKEDCEIPLFVRGKLYADFRTNFDDGLRLVVESIAKTTNAYLARTTEPDFHTDWSVDWYSIDEEFFLRFTFVEHGHDVPYTVLTDMTIMLSAGAKLRYDRIEAEQSGDMARVDVVDALLKFMEQRDDLRMLLEDQFEKEEGGAFVSEHGDRYAIRIRSRRLGEDTGLDILVNRTGLIRQVHRHMHEVYRLSGDGA